ncbi:hypothetical protein FA95DRAFT_1347798 [Auriscalpium vulgare]|uniref:Uncharacterized protein n=1 Tax=Auriscalpium vulgare TaxID=40419 RepID=A0ACB8RRY6_9AGAM|nr:hypothetical protein FA95DRAFT_1347798 [Auriscalpium vulgare]
MLAASHSSTASASRLTELGPIPMYRADVDNAALDTVDECETSLHDALVAVKQQRLNEEAALELAAATLRLRYDEHESAILRPLIAVRARHNHLLPIFRLPAEVFEAISAELCALDPPTDISAGFPLPRTSAPRGDGLRSDTPSYGPRSCFPHLGRVATGPRLCLRGQNLIRYLSPLSSAS